MNLCLHRRWVVLSLVATIAVACGGDVGSEAGTSGAATGGSGWGTGGTSGVGNPPGVGGGFALGGSIGIGGGPTAGGASSGLPWKCTAGFDPGYTCNGAYPVDYYVYDAATANCRQATYNGCGGSTGGAFGDARICVAMCEQRPSDTGCPLYVSEGTACSVPGAFCSYGSSNCLCSVLGSYGCLYSDPRCSGLGINSNSKPRCNGETCTITQDIIVITSRVCTCDSGVWSCSYSFN